MTDMIIIINKKIIAYEYPLATKKLELHEPSEYSKS